MKKRRREKNKKVTKRSGEMSKLTQGEVSMNSNRVCVADYIANFNLSSDLLHHWKKRYPWSKLDD